MLPLNISTIYTPPSPPPSVRRKFSKWSLKDVKCSNEGPLCKTLVSLVATSVLLISTPTQATQLNPNPNPNPNPNTTSNTICHIAAATENRPTLTLDSEGEEGNNMMELMTRGMTAKDFDPVRYSGRWFEVASLKRGFAGQGQEDCHCTQGVYKFDEKSSAIQVDTFCVHGGPDGYITGIRGRVQCLSDPAEQVSAKCYLRFPTLPFIPKQPYDVIETDYEGYALVSGAKDKSFVQIYSRTPNPGQEFIEKYKSYLANFGYDPSKIKDTPQDCEVMSGSQLDLMMSMPGMNEALTNQFPDLKLNKSVQFDPFTSTFETLKKLFELYFK